MHVFIAAIATSCLSMSGIFVRLSEVGPIATGFFRFFFAIPLLWLWMMIENARSSDPPIPVIAKDYIALVVSGAFLAVDIMLWNFSLTMTTVMHAALFNNFTTVFVCMFAWGVLGEKPSLSMILGILLTFVGAFVLVRESFYLDLTDFYGDFMALLSALFFAGYIVTVKYLRHRFSTSTILSWSGLFTLYFIALGLPLELGAWIPKSFYGWGILLGFTVVTHLMGQGLLNYAMKTLTAGFASMVLMIGPIVAATVAWFLFDETLTYIQLIGATIILIGIAVARSSPLEKSPYRYGVSWSASAPAPSSSVPPIETEHSFGPERHRVQNPQTSSDPPEIIQKKEELEKIGKETEEKRSPEVEPLSDSQQTSEFETDSDSDSKTDSERHPEKLVEPEISWEQEQNNLDKTVKKNAQDKEN